MTPKQKRAMNQLRKAIVTVAAETVNDPSMVNPATALLLRAGGSMLGFMSAAQAISLDDLDGAIRHANSYFADEAATAYGEYLASEKHMTKGGH